MLLNRLSSLHTGLEKLFSSQNRGIHSVAVELIRLNKGLNGYVRTIAFFLLFRGGNNRALRQYELRVGKRLGRKS